MKKTILITALILIVGAGAFFGGMEYGQSNKQAKGNNNFRNIANMQNLSEEQRQQMMQQAEGRRGAGGNGGFTSGKIIAKDDKSITVELNGGGSKIVFFSDATKVGQYTDGKIDDLAVGKSVMVNGSSNQDGSVTAQMIQVRPEVLNQPQSQQGQQPNPQLDDQQVIPQ